MNDKPRTFQELFSTLSADQKRQLARDAGTSVAYLSHLANGQRKAGRKSIKALLAADNRITIDMLLAENP